ncbi:MAG: acetamidase/formamidase family protein [Verrucomicrobia bacterium]|nr:acetamidase/formamidase family protein [Verrucomicrobiota bacterium]
MAEHFLGKAASHCRWNNALAPALSIAPGDTVCMECHDSSGGQVTPDLTLDGFRALDRERIHTLTGPVEIRSARPGDVLEVRVRRVEHLGWGWTSFVPGMGLLPERFAGPYLHLWELEENVTRSLPPAVVPLRPFCGIMGVAPAAVGEHRTRPPGVFGGNMDVKQLVAGSTLYLPVQVAGALFSAGDAHAAQGDGEICVNAIEMPANAEFEFHLRRDFSLDEPFAETPPAARDFDDQGNWAFIASRTDPLEAVKSVVNRAVDFLAARFSYSPEAAYVLCSVVLNLRISQWVNQPTVTITGLLPKALFATNSQP